MNASLGAGQLTSGGEVSGRLHRADDSAQVFELMKRGDLDEVILLTGSPSATAVVPLLGRVRGIVCESGGATSHLAIVSREFGIACVMAADLGAVDEGATVTIGADGSISRA